MTARELIEELESHDLDMEVYIGDAGVGSLKVYDIVEEEIEESVWFENKFMGYKKIRVIVLER